MVPDKALQGDQARTDAETVADFFRDDYLPFESYCVFHGHTPVNWYD